MKKLLAVFLGILTAIGGFVDIGDLVASSAAGARFGVGLAWVMVAGVAGIIVYAEMCGRVAALSSRPVFDLVRERLGPRVGLVNLVASFLINLLTLTAEVAGVAIAFSLLAGVSYLLFVPAAAFLVWFVIWRMPFETMERVFGLAGLALLVFVVALVHLHPDWQGLLRDATRPAIGDNESPFTYAYLGIALFGSAMTPYEVFFFSSGAVEERWTRRDLSTERLNVFVGFPIGGLLSLAIMALAAQSFLGVDIKVSTLPQMTLPVAATLGKVGLALVILGVFAATFGAAIETTLSAGYTVSQYLGWQWGKYVRPRDAARFHLVMLVSLVIGTLFLLTGVDPVKVTEYSLVLSAAALPLTYFPILVIANDRDYMGDQCNGRVLNAVAMLFLLFLVVLSIAAVPLMVITKGGG